MNKDYDRFTQEGEAIHQAFDSVRAFEKCVSEYAGSKYAIAVDSCTNALFLCCKYLKVNEVTIPSVNYPSVPAAILHAGGKVNFKSFIWKGAYQLEPYPIIDSALSFHRGMYSKDSFYCLSFNTLKHLKIGKGGMILTNDRDAFQWFKSARYLGRHENPCYNEDCNCDHSTVDMVGWNMIMTPDQASRGLMLMHGTLDNNEDLDFFKLYDDLTAYPIFDKDNYDAANRPST